MEKKVITREDRVMAVNEGFMETVRKYKATHAETIEAVALLLYEIVENAVAETGVDKKTVWAVTRAMLEKELELEE